MRAASFGYRSKAGSSTGAMTQKPPEPEDEKEAERRFNETLGRMLSTPPKPHKPKEGGTDGDTPHSTAARGRRGAG